MNIKKIKNQYSTEKHTHSIVSRSTPSQWLLIHNNDNTSKWIICSERGKHNFLLYILKLVYRTRDWVLCPCEEEMWGRNVRDVVPKFGFAWQQLFYTVLLIIRVNKPNGYIGNKKQKATYVTDIPVHHILSISAIISAGHSCKQGWMAALLCNDIPHWLDAYGSFTPKISLPPVFKNMGQQMSGPDSSNGQSRLGVRVPLRLTQFRSRKHWQFHNNIRSCVKNECCCPGTVNNSNANFTLKK